MLMAEQKDNSSRRFILAPHPSLLQIQFFPTHVAGVGHKVDRARERAPSSSGTAGRLSEWRLPFHQGHDPMRSDPLGRLLSGPSCKTFPKLMVADIKHETDSLPFEAAEGSNFLGGLGQASAHPPQQLLSFSLSPTVRFNDRWRARVFI